MQVHRNCSAQIYSLSQTGCAELHVLKLQEQKKTSLCQTKSVSIIPRSNMTVKSHGSLLLTYFIQGFSNIHNYIQNRSILRFEVLYKGSGFKFSCTDNSPWLKLIPNMGVQLNISSPKSAPDKVSRQDIPDLHKPFWCSTHFSDCKTQAKQTNSLLLEK